MDIVINWWAVVVCAVLSMVVGFVWYGPLFGKKWMEIIGANPSDMARREEMQKAAGKLYVVQFVLSLFQVYVLARFVAEGTGLGTSLWVWAGFLIPTLAAGAMWNNDSSKVAWSRFLIQAGYNLILMVAFGLILGAWQ